MPDMGDSSSPFSPEHQAVLREVIETKAAASRAMNGYAKYEPDGDGPITEREALEGINKIRNSIVGLQTINWSEHIYPLVSLLNRAGMEGLDYPEARANYGTCLAQRNEAVELLRRVSEKWNAGSPDRVEIEALLKRIEPPSVSTGSPLSRRLRPLLLDMFCGAGGCSVGYHRAGFDVIGVDIEPQPNYPFPFVQADALGFAEEIPECYAAIHASPPCQAHSTLRHRTGNDYPDLVARTRELLQDTGLPYVIENVVGAPLYQPTMLCGSMFGLGANGRQLRRHRLFETNFPVLALKCHHEGQPVGVYGTGGGGQMTRGYKGTPEEYREAMGIDWASRAEIAQAIPPMYTEFVGGFLMVEINARQKVAA